MIKNYGMKKLTEREEFLERERFRARLWEALNESKLDTEQAVEQLQAMAENIRFIHARAMGGDNMGIEATRLPPHDAVKPDSPSGF